MPDRIPAALLLVKPWNQRINEVRMSDGSWFRIFTVTDDPLSPTRAVKLYFTDGERSSVLREARILVRPAD